MTELLRRETGGVGYPCGQFVRICSARTVLWSSSSSNYLLNGAICSAPSLFVLCVQTPDTRSASADGNHILPESSHVTPMTSTSMQTAPKTKRLARLQLATSPMIARIGGTRRSR